MKKRNHLILLMLTITASSFSGCGTQTDNTKNSVDSVQTLEDDTVDVADTSTLDNSTVDNSTEESSVTETSAASEDSSNVAESTKTDEADAPEASVEDSLPEETTVEMVDFETWAKQEGNEEVCLVVWNEELGVQKILPPFQEKEEITPPLVDYREISFSPGGQVVIIFQNKAGELQTTNYKLSFLKQKITE